jgi:phosphogluconate dehydratase
MGLHLPGAAFVHPYTPLREALTREAARRALSCEVSVGDMIDEKSLVNAVVGLLATGGSTNHTLHLIAIARMAGIELCWDDFDQLASVVPLITKMYPNGGADVNHFHASGGMGLVIRELLDAGLLHEDVQTIMGKGLRHYTQEPFLSDDGALLWRDAPKESLDTSVLRSVHHPFSPDGGIKLVQGSLGRAIVKVSAVPSDCRVIEAPAIVFEDQHSLIDAFKQGELDRDFIAVIRYQGPCANGMPELHKLTPTLSVLQDRGFKVALVTDGRMSGASGNVLAAIHVSPEAKHGGPIAKIQTGDKIRLDAIHGVLEVLVSRDIWSKRSITLPDFASNESGYGRELFASFREAAGSADRGAMSFNHPLFS